MAADMFIRYVDLYKSFGDKQVLRGVDLEIGRGQTVVVLGGSGSGKSVLIRHTIGLHHPDAGEVWVDGEEVHPGRRRPGGGRVIEGEYRDVSDAPDDDDDAPARGRPQ